MGSGAAVQVTAARMAFACFPPRPSTLRWLEREIAGSVTGGSERSPPVARRSIHRHTLTSMHRGVIGYVFRDSSASLTVVCERRAPKQVLRNEGGRGSPRLPVTSEPPEKRGAHHNHWEYRADPVKRQYQIICSHDAARPP